MASVSQIEKLTVGERRQRYFSDQFKRKKVSEIERNISTVAEICREYQVCRAAVYKWIYKFSSMRKKGVKQVIEAKSDTRKIVQLKDQVKELERLVGQKQIEVEFLEKMIELAEEQYGIDLKKKSNSKPISGIGATGKNIRGK